MTDLLVRPPFDQSILRLMGAHPALFKQQNLHPQEKFKNYAFGLVFPFSY